MEVEFQNLRTEKKVLKKSVEDIITEASKEPGVHPKTAERVLNSVNPQSAGSTMRVRRLISA